MNDAKLTDAEVDLINMIRGYAADGDGLIAPWTLGIHLSELGWAVRMKGTENGGRYSAVSGEHPTFDEAWASLNDEKLDEALSAPAEPIAANDKGSPRQLTQTAARKPRLQLIKSEAEQS